jgi:hypothetical protein
VRSAWRARGDDVEVLQERYDEYTEDAIVLPSAMNVVVGVWLVLSPFAMGFAGRELVWNVVPCGAAIAVLALLRVSRMVQTPVPSWANVMLGAWLFAAGFILDARPTVAVNQCICGGVVFLLALSSALNARDDR